MSAKYHRSKSDIVLPVVIEAVLQRVNEVLEARVQLFWLNQFLLEQLDAADDRCLADLNIRLSNTPLHGGQDDHFQDNV